MDQPLDAMANASKQMMADLKYVRDFDFENANVADLEKIDEFLRSRIATAEKMKKNMEKAIEALDNKE